MRALADCLMRSAEDLLGAGIARQRAMYERSGRPCQDSAMGVDVAATDFIQGQSSRLELSPFLAPTPPLPLSLSFLPPSRLFFFSFRQAFHLQQFFAKRLIKRPSAIVTYYSRMPTARDAVSFR